MRKKTHSIFLAVVRFCFSLLVFGFYFLLTPLSAAQEVARSTVIKNVRVFDGEKVIPACTVVIKSGKIQHVGEKAVVSEGSKIIDGEGLTILPGFFDSHVHIFDSQSLKQSLVFGVTTVVDMFMDIKTMAAQKKMQSSGSADDMAFLISAGTLATAPGGHGTQYGLSIPTVSKAEDAQDFVEARIAEGSDFIKIIYDDGSAYNLQRPTLDKATISALADAARQKGKLSIIHAATLQNCKDALEAGVSGLAHLFFDKAFDPEFGRLAAKKKIFVIPTLTVLEGMHGLSGALTLSDDVHLSPYLKPSDIQMLKFTFPFSTQKGAFTAAKTALKQLKTENVPILAGTDAPNPGTAYGASLHRELELLVDSGFSPLEALRSATSIPAQTFGLSDRGRIQKGLVADLVLVRGDPIKDIKVTRNIVEVWRGGVKVNRKNYEVAVEKEKKSLEQQKKAAPPENAESGWISDFEGDKITANFGSGWSVSTDAFIGGKSTAEYQLEKNGAQGSQGALLITGIVAAESPTPWAGAYFSPGPTFMSPANLSFKKSISFWAKGDGRTYSVMIFAQSLGFIPKSQTFVAGPEWKEFTFPYEDFSIKGFDIMGIFIGSSTEMGKFKLKIDDVRLK